MSVVQILSGGCVLVVVFALVLTAVAYRERARRARAAKPTSTFHRDELQRSGRDWRALNRNGRR